MKIKYIACDGDFDGELLTGINENVINLLFRLSIILIHWKLTWRIPISISISLVTFAFNKILEWIKTWLRVFNK